MLTDAQRSCSLDLLPNGKTNKVGIYVQVIINPLEGLGFRATLNSVMLGKT